MRTFIVAVLALSLGDAARAQPVGEITDPVWTQQPTPSQRSETYPFKAMANEKTGVAVVRCTAQADGSLGDCAVVCETPDGWGFGKGGLRMAKFLRMEPQQADGRPVAGGTVTLPFHFNPPFLPRVPRCDGKAELG